MNHTATYSPEDNKIRIYPGQRLDDELGDRYAAFKAAGYKWAAKQECFVCPRWTPHAEDWALELCGEIGDEDYGALERSEDRAERFGGYRDKRRAEAHGAADSFDAGPAAFGHQSEARAARQARRHDRHRTNALSQWSKAEYWQYRTQGVIRHALHKSSPSVRRGRILTLEAEQRKHEKSLAASIARYKQWQAVAELAYANIATKAAMALANASICWIECVHPRSGHKTSLYSHLNCPVDPISGHEAAALYLAAVADPQREGSYSARWSAHYNLRLEYERAMLENEGGSAAAVEIEPGGFMCGLHCSPYNQAAPRGWAQVLAVVRSPATKRVTSVKVMGIIDAHRTGQVAGVVTCNVERLPADAYRPPTDEERAAFIASQTATKQAAAKARAANPAPSLVNPTDGDAERLQLLWNARHAERRGDKGSKPSEVLRMTQAQYSARSKGAYSSFETRTIYGDAQPSRRSTNMWTPEGRAYDKQLAGPTCKLRVGPSGGWDSPDRVIIITDKPQKPLPIDWAAIEAPEPVEGATAPEAEPVAAGLLF